MKQITGTCVLNHHGEIVPGSLRTVAPQGEAWANLYYSTLGWLRLRDMGYKSVQIEITLKEEQGE